jgi:protoporphyrinogen oxidase
MNTSMVDRIPKPTQEEIRRSAAGETVDGYVHQLYFSYPTNGGIESVPNGFLSRLNADKCRVEVNSEVVGVRKKGKRYVVTTASSKEYEADCLISTIPVQALTKAFADTTPALKKCVGDLRYNSISISFVRTPYDLCGENYAFMIPDKNVIFHRISKMDFLGDAYHRDSEATYMVEVTYRKNDQVDTLSDEQFRQRIMQGMVDIGFAHSVEDVSIVDITKYEYAYVIYDLDHSKNMENIRKFYADQGVILNGRFGNFEYWNMDRILRESYELSLKLGGTK